MFGVVFISISVMNPRAADVSRQLELAFEGKVQCRLSAGRKYLIVILCLVALRLADS